MKQCKNGATCSLQVCNDLDTCIYPETIKSPRNVMITAAAEGDPIARVLTDVYDNVREFWDNPMPRKFDQEAYNMLLASCRASITSAVQMRMGEKQ